MTRPRRQHEGLGPADAASSQKICTSVLNGHTLLQGLIDFLHFNEFVQIIEVLVGGQKATICQCASNTLCQWEERECQTIYTGRVSSPERLCLTRIKMASSLGLQSTYYYKYVRLIKNIVKQK